MAKLEALNPFAAKTGNRKFKISMTALLCAFVLALQGTVSGGNFVAIVAAVVGLFGGANALEHHAKNGGG